MTFHWRTRHISKTVKCPNKFNLSLTKTKELNPVKKYSIRSKSHILVCLCYRCDTYKSRQRSGVSRFNLQRFVEKMVGKVFLGHVVHRVQVLKELLLQKQREHVTPLTQHTHTHTCQQEVTSWPHWPWCRSPPSDSMVGSGTAGSLRWFLPLSSSCWSWSGLCRVAAGSPGYPPPSSKCWSGRFLTDTQTDWLNFDPSCLTLYKPWVCQSVPKKGTQGGLMERSLAKYFL